MIAFFAIRVNSILIKQSENYNTHIRYHIANDYFRQGTDSLTESVRRYIITMKPEFMDQYFAESQIERHRERALEVVNGLPIDQEPKTAMENAMVISKKLMDIEYHAMHLVGKQSQEEKAHIEVKDYPLTEDEEYLSLEQRHALAQELLWDENYMEPKNEIYAFLASGIEAASISSMAKHNKLKKELLNMICGLAIGLIFLLITIFVFILYRRIQHERMMEAQVIEIEKMNAQLKMERDKSIKAEKAKTYFFSTVSHDIRTPLNAIIGFSEMLQLGIDDPEEKSRALDAIITSGHTLLELINDVLDLSKLEAGKMELHPVPTDIANLVSKVAASFDAAAVRTSVKIITEVQKMPFLKLDPQRIRQILFNLIGNAVKFTDKGSVSVKASYEHGTFILSVTDTGCGISEDDIKKLMSPYVQIHSKDGTMGTGLGLAICKQLASQMNGTLGITSTVGKGSTFTLRVPNVIAFSDQESEAYVNEQNRNQIITLLDKSIEEKNILIVDDQKLNQSILRTMLSRLGIRKVLTANNGKEALDVLRKAGNVDIVLTDMFMPELDGDGLVREIRKSKEYSKITVCVVTADAELQNQYREKGFDNVLIKPITLERLNNTLAKCKPHEGDC